MREEDAASLDKPLWFTEDAYVAVEYTSPRETRGDTKSVLGRITDDDSDRLLIEERGRPPNNERVNEHRMVVLDLDTLDLISRTESRDTKLGQVTEVSMWDPPWGSSHDEIATGWSMVAHWYGKLIHEGVWTFPDPDWMEMPEGWRDE